jgi:hypothetical protein
MGTNIVTVQMLSRRRPGVLVIAVLFGVAALAAGCEKVPLLAPGGSTITLTASTTALPVNGTTQLIAQVIEAGGTPPHTGTQVSFTTTLGTIEPSDAHTDANGRVIVTFKAGSANGTATITAISGGASVAAANAVKIAVGTAAVGRVNVSASPSLIPALGGSATITTTVFDINGNPLPSAPVTYSTTTGTLDPTFGTTDANGAATTTLRTSTKATVTASVGAQAPATPPATGTGTAPASGQASGTVTVDIAAAPALVITPPATTPTSGLPATFTFVVTAAAANGSAIRSVAVNWGDGSTQDLGAVTGTAAVSHTYRTAGSYTISATVTDASGNVVTVATAVTVNATQIGLTITPPATPPSAGLPATFTFTLGTLPPGDFVKDVIVDWGDGKTQDLGAISATTTVAHVYTTADSYTVRATLHDTAGNSTTVSTSVTVVATSNPTIIITPTVPVGHPADVTFQIQVTAPSGVGILEAVITFGDGSSQSLGGLSGTVTLRHTYTAAGSYAVTLTVKDTLNRTTTGSTSVTIS